MKEEIKIGPLVTIKVGSTIISIYESASAGGYLAKWATRGKTYRIQGKNLVDLKKRVRAKAKSHDEGHLDIKNLTEAQVAACRVVIEQGITVAQLETISTIEAITLDEAVKRFLRAKQDTSSNNQRGLKTHTGQLCRKLGKRNIGSILPAELDDFLLAAAPSNLTTRKNKRATVVGLWRWCRDKRLLKQDQRTAAEQTDRVSLRNLKRTAGRVDTWSPDELALMLQNCPPEYLPWLVLSAFAGIRTLEIFPDEKDPDIRKEVLQWEDIEEDRIVIRPAVAKTAEERIIPICPALRAWLKLVRRKSGQIVDAPSPWRELKRWKGKSCNGRLAAAAGVPWRKNGLRHGFGTYRVAQVGGVGAVALEMGNSERMIRKHYHDVGRTPEEAKQWFSLTPAKVKRMIRIAG